MLVTAIMLALAAPVHAAPDTPGAASFDYGYFCALEPIGEEETGDTVSGSVHFVEGLPIFAAHGPLVPAQLGIGFGVHVLVHTQYAGPALIVIEHPPMGPSNVTRQSWPTEFDAKKTSYVGYSFEYEYELLPGTWTMSAQANGRTIYRASFDVIRPPKSQGNPCDPNVPLS